MDPNAAHEETELKRDKEVAEIIEKESEEEEEE